MSEKMLVSVVMPAYNVEKYIGQAIDSVLFQDYDNWELVVCDDCSTDNTVKEIEKFSDKRIRLIHTEYNSGSAILPRYLAAKTANGEYVLFLDADDYLESSYIKKMVDRIRNVRGGADVCLCQMVIVDENGISINRTIPKSDFDFELQLNGRQALDKTVPGWEIGGVGAYSRNIYCQCVEKILARKAKLGIHDDEIAGRLMLAMAKQVIFSRAKYFYRLNSASVTHTFNQRIFEYLDSVDLEKEFYMDMFGADSWEVEVLKRKKLNIFKHCMSEFLNNLSGLNCGEIKEINSEFKRRFCSLDRKYLIIRYRKIYCLNYYWLFLTRLKPKSLFFILTNGEVLKAIVG